MNSTLSEIVCIIDRSGSMDAIRSDAIGGFNSFITDQKAQPGQALLTLVLFDDEYDVIHDAVNLNAVPPLNELTYIPRGSTALLDAVGRTLDSVGKRLSETPEPERPATVVVVAILTDGLENASKQYTARDVSQRIKHQQAAYDWRFVFLAAGQDAFKTAEQLSIDAEDTTSFVASGDGVQKAYAAMSMSVADRRRPSKRSKS